VKREDTTTKEGKEKLKKEALISIDAKKEKFYKCFVGVNEKHKNTRIKILSKILLESDKIDAVLVIETKLKEDLYKQSKMEMSKPANKEEFDYWLEMIMKDAEETLGVRWIPLPFGDAINIVKTIDKMEEIKKQEPKYIG